MASSSEESITWRCITSPTSVSKPIRTRARNAASRSLKSQTWSGTSLRITRCRWSVRVATHDSRIENLPNSIWRKFIRTNPAQGYEYDMCARKYMCTFLLIHCLCLLTFYVKILRKACLLTHSSWRNLLRGIWRCISRQTLSVRIRVPYVCKKVHNVVHVLHRFCCIYVFLWLRIPVKDPLAAHGSGRIWRIISRQIRRRYMCDTACAQDSTCAGFCHWCCCGMSISS